MNRLLVGLALGLGLMLTTPAMAAFDFRGFPLGMSLATFKAVPYPDDPDSGLKPDCTDGPYSSLGWRANAVGIVHCNFMGEVEPLNYAGPGLDLKLEIGNYHTRYGRYYFAFAPDELGVDRLYKISLGAHIGAFQSIVARMTSLYGPATSITEVAKGWPKGSPYRFVYTWRQGASRLVVEAGDRERQGEGYYAEDGVDIIFTDAAREQALRQAMEAVRPGQTQRRPLAAPYLFRGLALDTRLEVFKALPYPDGRRAGVPLCTDESRVALADQVLNAAGVVHCDFVAAKSNAPDSERLVSLKLNLGFEDIHARGGGYSYAFAPDNRGVKRLYRISLHAPLSVIETVIAKMSERYGPPSSVVETPQDWPVGSPYRHVYTWQSSGHRIVVQASEKRLQGEGFNPEDGMSIDYVSIAHAEAVERAVDALTPARNPQGK